MSARSQNQQTVLHITKYGQIYYYIFFKYLFCAKAAPTLVLVTCVEKDDVAHWVVKHKTRWYLSLVTTDCDILDLENCLLKGKCDVSWHNSKGIKKFAVSPHWSLFRFFRNDVPWSSMKSTGRGMTLALCADVWNVTLAELTVIFFLFIWFYLRNWREGQKQLKVCLCEATAEE